MQISPYLMFDGQCEAAFKHYADALDGKIVFMSRYSEAPTGSEPGCADGGPQGGPPTDPDHILHMALAIDGQTLLGSDCPPGYFEKASGTSVSIGGIDRAHGERIFNALAEGGTVKMPYAETFWADGFGMCVDRFGIPWMVSAGQKEPTDA